MDYITDTGESIMISVNYVKSLNPREVRTATLRHIEGSKFKPDYYAEDISWRWVIFPWNFIEDLCNLIDQIRSEVKDPKDLAEFKRKLKENFKIDVDEETIEEILRELDRRKMLKGVS